MKGEWGVSSGEMYDAAPHTISCWRVIEYDRYSIECRTIAVFFDRDEAWEVIRVHNDALKAVPA